MWSITTAGVFRWATENELIPASVYHGLQAVTGLKLGRTDARESAPIEPVVDAVVEQTLPYLTSVVSAMVQVQRLCGARPNEVCQLRTGDIDRSGPVLTYKPAMHKTAHHGRQRSICIGPKAQPVLAPFLKPLNPTACIFSPADSMAEVRERRHAQRKTPLSGYQKIQLAHLLGELRGPAYSPARETRKKSELVETLAILFADAAEGKLEDKALAERVNAWIPANLREAD